jgi:predicted chitinase
MVDKRGGTQRVQKGNDLYDLFSVRSYKCSVDGIGNMNIQPLSYFQLDNVPFYRGAYLITSVEHSITPNHMTTSFSGLRQSRFSTPVEENTSTFLNINFEEVDEIAIKSQAQKFVNTQSDVNNNFQILNPESIFDIPTRLSQTNLNQLLTDIGGSNISTQFLSNSLIKWLPKFGLKTNSEVCNFLAQCAFESRKFNYSVETWDKPKPNSDGVATNGSGAQLKYEGNSKLGNTEKGDGLRFKGRGFIQVTGRSNYKNLQNDNTSDGSTGTAGDLFTNITTLYDNKDGYLNIDKLFNNKEEKGIERSVVASLIWWKNSGIGTLNKGTVAEAQLVSKKVNPGQGDETINGRTKFLEKIADYFNLKTDYIGGTESSAQ